MARSVRRAVSCAAAGRFGLDIRRVDSSSPVVQELMCKEYGEYLSGLDEAYRDHVFAYVEKDDSPRPHMFQMDRLRDVGSAMWRCCTRAPVSLHFARRRSDGQR